MLKLVLHCVPNAVGGKAFAGLNCWKRRSSDRPVKGSSTVRPLLAESHPPTFCITRRRDSTLSRFSRCTEPDVRGFDGHANPQRQRFLIFHRAATCGLLGCGIRKYQRLDQQRQVRSALSRARFGRWKMKVRCFFRARPCPSGKHRVPRIAKSQAAAWDPLQFQPSVQTRGEQTLESSSKDLRTAEEFTCSWAPSTGG